MEKEGHSNQPNVQQKTVLTVRFYSGICLGYHFLVYN